MKKSELRLLIVFGIMLVAAVTYFALGIVKGKENGAIARQNAARAKKLEYETLIAQKAKWEVLRDFVNKYQPVYTTEEKEAPKLEAYFRANAQAENVEVTTLLPKEPEKLGDSMMALSLEARVSGAGTDVLRFLTRLQGDNKFYAIRSVTLSADRKDPSIVKLDQLIFSRWFTLTGDSSSAEEVDPAGDVAPASAPVAVVPNPTANPRSIVPTPKTAVPATRGGVPKSASNPAAILPNTTTPPGDVETEVEPEVESEVESQPGDVDAGAGDVEAELEAVEPEAVEAETDAAEEDPAAVEVDDPGAVDPEPEPEPEPDASSDDNGTLEPEVQSNQ